MALPRFLQPYLPSYNLGKLDLENSSVRKEIATQILNSGDDQVLSWLFKNFSLGEIKNYLRSPQKGMWFKRALGYWSKIFNLKIPRSKFNQAIFNLDPYVSSRSFK